MTRNELKHFIKEREKLTKRIKQIDNRLSEIGKDMNILEQNAFEMIRSLKGEDDSIPREIEKSRPSRTKVILDY